MRGVRPPGHVAAACADDWEPDVLGGVAASRGPLSVVPSTSGDPVPRSRAVIAVVVAIVVVVGAYFLGAASENPAPPPSTAPTAAPTGAPATAADAGEPDGPATDSPLTDDPTTDVPTPDAEATADPTSPEPAVSPFTGTAATTDPADDVTDEAGVPAPGEPTAADVVEARVEGDGTSLTFTYSLNGEVPPDGESLVWSIEFAVDGEQVALVTVEQAGTRLFTGVFDPATGEQRIVEDAATLTPGQLVVTVPRSALPEVDGPVEWFLLTQRDGGYEDRIPDAGAAGRLPFPG